ncbi:MAG TPA: ATP-binding cassette domain-containing protein [Candidatus Scybalocola faecigallinarum]|uniref:ATP-binding cassette domain-containing protein n=1 Tax=Candidatus Scybalocola faecigallinarum TaxID=2840941 RepID=A0A9D1F2Q0_9FIRM|nr:ATP-binding cassette domain-containing protein [Candidatus Scybalocola faecigallinarum]
MDSVIVKIRGLKKYYGTKDTLVRALDGIDLDIEKGTFTAIVGASGSGKSTLLHMIGGLDTPTEGSVIVSGRNLSQLSGGQQQRVAIARALCVKPSILLCDEPTGNLDTRTSQDVLGLLKACHVRFHQTMIMITHNEEIAQLSDRILHIEDGRLVRRKWGEPCL